MPPVGRRLWLTGITLLALVATWPARAFAQGGVTVDIGVEVATLGLSELDRTEVGAGLRAAWWLTPRLAVDGGFSWFPDGRDSRGRSSGPLERQSRQLGVVGPRLAIDVGRVELSARVRPGVLRFAPVPGAACIAIFPPPFACVVAGGHLAFAVDVGAGMAVPLGAAGRARLTLDVGDVIVDYGFTALRRNGEVTDGLSSHNPLVSVGLSWRF